MSNAEVIAEYYLRAFVARDLAATATCADTKVYLLELEQLWLSQARRHGPSNCCARVGRGSLKSAITVEGVSAW
jgi:hypothetical protein